MLRITADIHDEDSYNEFLIGGRDEPGTMASTVLPGCRNSGQKAQKGPQKKKVGRKNLWPNFG